MKTTTFASLAILATGLIFNTTSPAMADEAGAYATLFRLCQMSTYSNGKRKHSDAWCNIWAIKKVTKNSSFSGSLGNRTNTGNRLTVKP